MTRADEIVTAVVGDIVVTQCGRVTTSYYGVTVRVRVGEILESPPPHESRKVRTDWSPFDAPGDDAAADDADADPDAGRRIF